MPHRPLFQSRARPLRFLLLACLGASAALPVASRDARIHLAPKFAAGQTLRYRIDTHTTTTQHITSPIVNPQGGTDFSQTLSLVVRVDVLDVPAAAQRAAVPVRFRATYEKSHSDSQTDAFDPAAPSPDDSYNNLEGHSIEFTLSPRGDLSGLTGLENLFPNPSQADPVLSWLKILSIGSAFPPAGVAIGEKWTSEQPLTGSPISGMVTRSQSTYLRDEPCSASVASNPSTKPPATGQPLPSGDTCAVILTRLEILRHGSATSDATPDDYRRNGLRTSGKWTGSGESYDYISLSSGLLVSSTQSGTQDMGYVITSATSGSNIHRVARIESHSQITLVPASP